MSNPYEGEYPADHEVVDYGDTPDWDDDDLNDMDTDLWEDDGQPSDQQEQNDFAHDDDFEPMEDQHLDGMYEE